MKTVQYKFLIIIIITIIIIIIIIIIIVSIITVFAGVLFVHLQVSKTPFTILPCLVQVAFI